MSKYSPITLDLLYQIVVENDPDGILDIREEKVFNNPFFIHVIKKYMKMSKDKHSNNNFYLGGHVSIKKDITITLEHMNQVERKYQIALELGPDYVPDYWVCLSCYEDYTEFKNIISIYNELSFTKLCAIIKSGEKRCCNEDWFKF